MSNVAEIPILVGIGDINDRESKGRDDAAEPLTLMLRAIGAAIQDTTLPPEAAQKLQSAIESIGVVANWTWPYPNTPELLVQRLGLSGTVHTTESHHGGDSPGQFFDEAARRVAYKKSKVAVVTGAEALASLEAFKKSKKFPPQHWTKLDDHTSIWDRKRPEDLGTRHMLGAPIQVYPLYEAAFRAHLQQKLSDNHKESADLYADFAQVAAKSPFSWSHGQEPETSESIGAVTKRNRMICSPYPLLMNAFNTVNLAAACIITTTTFARELGIPESKWIYPLGGAGTSDGSRFWERPYFHASRSLSQSLDAALKASEVRTEDIDLFDFYSCFPIVPKLAAHHLGLPLHGPKPLTVLGGLTSFGGAGNNYSMHAITEIARQLRTRKQSPKAQNGLVLANGGVLSYHHTVILSTQPRSDSGYPMWNPLSSHLDEDHPAIEEQAEGSGVIETYTVQFGRDGSPILGFVVGRLLSGAGNGGRFVANVQDAYTLQQLCSSTEQIGKQGWVTTEGGRNLFVFKPSKI
ncbi:hypothetical protein ASPVEDRAFT_131121 [Aspergillus versicolor CBS 583.65]|uniref:Uncharacterized protein n=1 Tax=Aspergillus versicolor CBS 583.65 TaxID=1036611 RepID=A0A1L9PHX9_ASPVE|nr:uncharacterized protein ASPVEDRAFT_131121 [Aspergillus versicolor CBS 583.65]OJJ01056.1 hypothetical protein ASPVEDRAFT_131121 [Aspergillus versicolor CBS 583.65]